MLIDQRFNATCRSSQVPAKKSIETITKEKLTNINTKGRKKNICQNLRRIQPSVRHIKFDLEKASPIACEWILPENKIKEIYTISHLIRDSQALPSQVCLQACSLLWEEGWRLFLFLFLRSQVSTRFSKLQKHREH